MFKAITKNSNTNKNMNKILINKWIKNFEMQCMKKESTNFLKLKQIIEE